MLQKFGWTQGKGLGKNEQGQTAHIKVKQKQDNLGLGATQKNEQTLEQFAPPPTLEMKKSKRKKKKDQNDTSGQSSGVVPGMTDDDLFQLCGGVRLSRRAGMKQLGKERRVADADAEFLAKYGGAAQAIQSVASSSVREEVTVRKKIKEKKKKPKVGIERKTIKKDKKKKKNPKS